MITDTSPQPSPGDVARLFPATPAQRHTVVAGLLNCWHPEAAWTALIYSAAILADRITPLEAPDTDYLRVPRALGLPPEITYFDDGVETFHVDAESWWMGVTGLHDIGRGLRPDERSIDDIDPRASIFGCLLIDLTIFTDEGCTPEQFLTAVPTVRAAARQVLNVSIEADPAAALAKYT